MKKLGNKKAITSKGIKAYAKEELKNLKVLKGGPKTSRGTVTPVQGSGG